MSLLFWRSYTSQAVQSANAQLMMLIAQIDPKGYDAAAIDAKEAQLLDLGKRIEAYNRQHDDAKKAFDKANNLNNQRLASIDILQQDLAKPENAGKKTKIEAGISSQLQLVTDAQAELDTLKLAEQTTLEIFQALDSTYQGKVQAFKSRRSELEQAKRTVELAETRHDMAQQRQEAAKVLAGIKQEGPDPIDAAVAAMKRKTDAINDETASLNRMATALTPSDSEKTNDVVAAAMSQASGAPASATSVEDRIAALKSRQAARAA